MLDDVANGAADYGLLNDMTNFGGNDRADRTGYLRGTVKDAHAMVDQFRALGCTRLSIAFREGPYDWEALEAFAAEIVRPG